MGLDIYLYEFSESSRSDDFVCSDRLAGEVFFTQEEYDTVPDSYKPLFVKGVFRQTYIASSKCVFDIINIIKGNDADNDAELTVDLPDGVKAYGSSGHADGFVHRYLVDEIDGMQTYEGQHLLEDSSCVRVYYEIRPSDDHDHKMMLSVTFDCKYNNSLKDYDGRYLAKDESCVYSAITKEIFYQLDGLSSNAWSGISNCEYMYDKSVIDELVMNGGLMKEFADNWEDGRTALYAWW